ncbi:MAE_28990/MAE_18760 family HEPN-like nuclease [Nocardia asteroides]|uniref:MAE_28990/MAE_18760 family HEPN-like nuclease n=1 Tax=Nocardia asteroides TaxID=1824 RepID=UPI0033C5D086
MDAESFSNSIHASLARRKRELTDIRLRIQLTDPNPSYLGWVARASIVLAYAHWEGFVKESSSKYIKLICARRIRVDQLHLSLQAACLTSHFKRAQNSEKTRYLASILTEIDDRRCNVFNVSPEKVIDTESNLSSTVFRDLVLGLGLDHHDIYDTRKAFIDETLLFARNKIAHGELVSYSRSEAVDRIDGVLLLLDVYADQLILAAKENKFLLANGEVP